MSINETISGDGFSAEANPTGATSDVVVGEHGAGRVVLQVKASGGEWATVSMQSGAYAVATPDAGLIYRFEAKGVSAAGAHVYFGA